MTQTKWPPANPGRFSPFLSRSNAEQSYAIAPERGGPSHNHKNFDCALRAEFGDRHIADQWISYFAVSTNLSTGQPTIHRDGPVWEAVRASGSIPGLLPPFFTRDGEMLVDGALMDAEPLGVIKQFKNGPNMVVSLTADRHRTYAVDYGSISGPGELTAALLNPLSRSRLPEIPGILEVLILSMLANRRYDLPLGDADSVFRPSFSSDINATSCERHAEIVHSACEQAVAWIRARMADGDEALRALIQ